MTDRANRKPLPGYRDRLLAAAPELAATPGVSHAMVLHDDACAIFQRGPCTCVPDIAITTMTGGSVLLIDEQGRARRTGRQ
ncbi:hypothetical protein ABIB83_008730 [Bradyrhizobium sp. I1.8.5]|uniref:hypothetical protein n=1 Tax=unclassified Bradyrhizobium TaxID=2631580 RepID=UPI0033990912